MNLWRLMITSLSLLGTPILGQTARTSPLLPPELGFRIYQANPASVPATIREVQNRTGKALFSMDVRLTSSLSHRWQEIFEALDLDEFGLPRCTLLIVGTRTDDSVMIYRFTPSPALEALARSMEAEYPKTPATPREEALWHRLHDRVIWLRMVQTFTVTLTLSPTRRLVGIEFRNAWEQTTLSSQQQAVFRTMRARLEEILHLREK